MAQLYLEIRENNCIVLIKKIKDIVSKLELDRKPKNGRVIDNNSHPAKSKTNHRE